MTPLKSTITLLGSSLIASTVFSYAQETVYSRYSSDFSAVDWSLMGENGGTVVVPYTLETGNIPVTGIGPIISVTYVISEMTQNYNFSDFVYDTNDQLVYFSIKDGWNSINTSPTFDVSTSYTATPTGDWYRYGLDSHAISSVTPLIQSTNEYHSAPTPTSLIADHNETNTIGWTVTHNSEGAPDEINEGNYRLSYSTINFRNNNFVVPEPSTSLLLLTGVTLGLTRRKR